MVSDTAWLSHEPPANHQRLDTSRPSNPTTWSGNWIQTVLDTGGSPSYAATAPSPRSSRRAGGRARSSQPMES